MGGALGLAAGLPPNTISCLLEIQENELSSRAGGGPPFFFFFFFFSEAIITSSLNKSIIGINRSIVGMYEFRTYHLNKFKYFKPQSTVAVM